MSGHHHHHASGSRYRRPSPEDLERAARERRQETACVMYVLLVLAVFGLIVQIFTLHH